MKTMSAGRRSHAALHALLAARVRGLRERGEDGFLLIEVMVSALMVALIVVGTFNGFDLANKATIDQRAHDQATLLAAQSQEQLRSEPATALVALITNPHTYTQTLNGTVYTITQEAKSVTASGESTGCSVSETSSNSGANFLVTSTVTWAALETSKATKFKRPGVKESAVISPPTGSAIEVDVTNGSGTGIPGVTAKATFEPVESHASNTVEGTTGSSGCVVLSGIQATSATVEIAQKSGFVTQSGALKVPPKTLSIAPNITTHYEVEYAEGGRIAAHYTYQGNYTYGGKEVTGDTFVAENAGKIKLAPEYFLGAGSTAACETAEEKYKFATGTFTGTDQTAACTGYPRGDLFPFQTPYVVYAGDCEANKDSEGEATATVTSGATTTVNVPMSYTKLTIWTGKYKASKGSELSENLKVSGGNAVKITNGECASAANPNGSNGFSYVHEQKETLTGGRLEDPFQPFGKQTLCVAYAKEKKTYTLPFTNSTVAGSTPEIYLGQRTGEEQSTKKSEDESKESALNAKISEETSHKSTWESELSTAEKTTKPKLETEIAEAKSKRIEAENKLTELKKKREKGEISEYTYNNEKTTWENKKNTEKTKETTRSSELSTLTGTTIPGLKTKITEATAKINGWNEELTTVKSSRKTLEEEITAEDANGVTVEGNRTSC